MMVSLAIQMLWSGILVSAARTTPASPFWGMAISCSVRFKRSRWPRWKSTLLIFLPMSTAFSA